MKVLLDTCVLYPVLLREILLRLARAGLYRPLWSARIFEEWAIRATKDGPEIGALVRGEQAVLAADFPKASIAIPAGLEARLWLPDPADVHVLAAAIAGSADVLLTFNAQDFPRRTLAEEDIDRASPDELLLELHDQATKEVEAVIAEIVMRLPEAPSARAVLKRAGLPRLGKRLAE